MSRLRFEDAIAFGARHMARALLDVAWTNGAVQQARMRCAFGHGWAALAESGMQLVKT